MCPWRVNDGLCLFLAMSKSGHKLCPYLDIRCPRLFCQTPPLMIILQRRAHRRSSRRRLLQRHIRNVSCIMLHLALHWKAGRLYPQHQRKASSATSSRTSTSSAGSRFSLEVSIPEDGRTSTESRTPSRMRRPSASRTESWRVSAGSSTAGKEDGTAITTPNSTASTPSIPTPVTPQAKGPTSPPLDKDKSLPPLPVQRYPSKTRISPVGNVGSTTTKYALPRPRTYSATATHSASTLYLKPNHHRRQRRQRRMSSNHYSSLSSDRVSP